MFEALPLISVGVMVTGSCSVALASCSQMLFQFQFLGQLRIENIVLNILLATAESLFVSLLRPYAVGAV